VVRVLAGDGYNTAVGVSAPFTVADRPPRVTIGAPLPDEVVLAGAAVPLLGTAVDPEEGGLHGEALVWRVDGLAVASGVSSAAPGLTPGDHTVTLTARDAAGNEAVASVPILVAPLVVPRAAAPSLDGQCDDAPYADGAVIVLPAAPGAHGGAVRLLRTDDHLWACFFGLPRGALPGGSAAQLLLDADHSRDKAVQVGDVRFLAAEDGSTALQRGDGEGAFGPAEPQGLVVRLGTAGGSWSAEMRIESRAIGGWDRLVGLALAHTSVSSAADDRFWPSRAVSEDPSSWAAADLGAGPTLVTLEPTSATVGDEGFTLAVRGSGFVSGTVALWDRTPLDTVVVDGTHVSATVTAAHLSGPGPVKVTVRGPGPDLTPSNAATFLVHAPRPVILAIDPGSVVAGSGPVVLTVRGASFAPDAQVLWDGLPLSTQFVDASHLGAAVPRDLLTEGRTVGISVRNQLPVIRVSGTMDLVVEPAPPLPTSIPSPTPSPGLTPPTSTPASATATPAVSPAPVPGASLYLPRAVRGR